MWLQLILKLNILNFLSLSKNILFKKMSELIWTKSSIPKKIYPEKIKFNKSYFKNKILN